MALDGDLGHGRLLPAVQARGPAQGGELRTEGRTNIDVGCMQINLGYHGHAFASLAEALEPASNVAYGAVPAAAARERSWARATARYHSAHPERGQAYREKVYRFWEQVRDGRVADRAPLRLAGRTAGRGDHDHAAGAGAADHAGPHARRAARGSRRDPHFARRQRHSAGRLNRPRTLRSCRELPKLRSP